MNAFSLPFLPAFLSLSFFYINTIIKKHAITSSSLLVVLTGTPRSRSVRPPKTTVTGRALRMSSESHLTVRSPRVRRTSGHVSDSELS